MNTLIEYCQKYSVFRDPLLEEVDLIREVKKGFLAKVMLELKRKVGID